MYKFLSEERCFDQGKNVQKEKVGVDTGILNRQENNISITPVIVLVTDVSEKGSNCDERKSETKPSQLGYVLSTVLAGTPVSIEGFRAKSGLLEPEIQRIQFRDPCEVLGAPCVINPM